MNKDDLREALIEADAVRHSRHISYAKAIGIPLAIIAAIVLFIWAYDAIDDARNGRSDFNLHSGR